MEDTGRALLVLVIVLVIGGAIMWWLVRAELRQRREAAARKAVVEARTRSVLNNAKAAHCDVEASRARIAGLTESERMWTDSADLWRRLAD